MAAACQLPMMILSHEKSVSFLKKNHILPPVAFGKKFWVDICNALSSADTALPSACLRRFTSLPFLEIMISRGTSGKKFVRLVHCLIHTGNDTAIQKR